jgi:hypothetical protein
MFRLHLLSVLVLSLSAQTSAQPSQLTPEERALVQAATPFLLRVTEGDSSDVTCSAGTGACGFLVTHTGSHQAITVSGLRSSTTYRVHPQNTCSVGDTDIPGFPYGFPKAYTTDASGVVTIPVETTADCLVIVGENIVNVASGANLQTAINTAIAGDTLLLAEGATFTGEFFLRAGTSNWVTIRGAGTGANITGNNNPGAIRTDLRAKYWYLENLDVRGLYTGTLIGLGSSNNDQDTMEKVPGWIVVDHVRVRGDAKLGGRTGITLHTSHTKIINSAITDQKGTHHSETKAIAGGNGPGPYYIADNLIQGAGINILFGGIDPPIIGLVPENIIITRNTISKPIEWHALGYNVKNLFELKNARFVRVTYNDFDGCWANPGNSNRGHCIWLKSVDQNVGGTYDCTLCEVRDVYIGYNKFTRIAGGPQVTRDGGEGTTPLPMRRVTFEHNLFEIDTSEFTNGPSVPVGGLATAGYNSVTKRLNADSKYKGVGVNCNGCDPGWDGTGGRPKEQP